MNSGVSIANHCHFIHVIRSTKPRRDSSRHSVRTLISTSSYWYAFFAQEDQVRASKLGPYSDESYRSWRKRLSGKTKMKRFEVCQMMVLTRLCLFYLNSDWTARFPLLHGTFLVRELSPRTSPWKYMSLRDSEIKSGGPPLPVDADRHGRLWIGHDDDQHCWRSWIDPKSLQESKHVSSVRSIESLSYVLQNCLWA